MQHFSSCLFLFFLFLLLIPHPYVLFLLFVVRSRAIAFRQYNYCVQLLLIFQLDDIRKKYQQTTIEKNQVEKWNFWKEMMPTPLYQMQTIFSLSTTTHTHYYSHSICSFVHLCDIFQQDYWLSNNVTHMHKEHNVPNIIFHWKMLKQTIYFM